MQEYRKNKDTELPWFDPNWPTSSNGGLQLDLNPDKPSTRILPRDYTFLTSSLPITRSLSRKKSPLKHSFTLSFTLKSNMNHSLPLLALPICKPPRKYKQRHTFKPSRRDLVGGENKSRCGELFFPDSRRRRAQISARRVPPWF